MNILVLCKLYLHKNKSGGEAYLHHFLKKMIEYGLPKPTIILPDKEKDDKIEFDGLTINETKQSLEQCLEYTHEADVVITQLDYAEETVKYCLSFNMRVIKIFHNSHYLYNDFIQNPNVCKIINSKYVLNDYLKRGLVPKNIYFIKPYTDYKKLSQYRNRKKGNYITFVNPQPIKGADIMVQLAKELPNEKFLIVKGGYYPEEQKPFLDEFEKLPNCHIIENTDDIINNIYLKSKIVMMPSIYDTYGMVASEASVFGIPVIVNGNSEGLVENCGKVCLKGYGKDIDSYKKVIEALSIPENYHIWSHYYMDVAKDRYYEIENQFHTFLSREFKRSSNTAQLKVEGLNKDLSILRSATVTADTDS